MRQELLPIAEQPLLPTAAECRVYERHACEVPTSCKPAAAQEMRWDATIRDVSRGGVRMTLRRRFEPGASLAIEVPGAPGEDAYTVFAKVVHLTQEPDGAWALGCRFVSELSEDELHRLLAAQPPAADQTVPAAVVVPAVRLLIEARPGHVIHGHVTRFHVAKSWPLAPGTTVRLRGDTRDGERLAHRFQVVRCRPTDDVWTLHVRLLDPTAAPAWLRTV